MPKYRMRLNGAAQQQIEKLIKILPVLQNCLIELIQFYEFMEQCKDTFPTAEKDFHNKDTQLESAPLYILQHSFRYNVLVCLVRMYDKDKRAASIPNAIKILQNEDIRFNLRQNSDDVENFDHQADVIDSISEEIQKDFRFDGALYMRDKHIAHRDIAAVVDWDRLSEQDIGTLYGFTASLVEAINQMIGVEPASFTTIMNQWQIVARDFHNIIPYSRKIAAPRPVKITSHYLGTREEFMKTFFGSTPDTKSET